MRNILLISLTLSACATTGLPSTSIDPMAPRARIELDFGAAPTDEAHLVVPVALDPKLPSVDRIASQLRVELGDQASATLHVCIAPAGHVTSASITQSSSSPAFDDALIHDITGWRFQPLPGPTGLKSCRNATVVYRS